MPEQPRLFRPIAVQRYLQGRQSSVLPRIIAPRTFAYLWSCIGLLGISGLTAWFTRIPVYISGSAVIAKYPATIQADQDRMVVLASFPPEAQGHLQVGQSLVLQLNQSEWIHRNVAEIRNNSLNLDPIKLEAIHDLGAFHSLAQSSTIAIAPLEALPLATAYMGRVYPVNVEVGSRRIISLLPLIGNLFEE